MTQLATLSEHLRQIERHHSRADYGLSVLAKMPQASPEEAARLLGQIESALEGVHGQANRAKAIAHELASRSRAVTVCHTRGEPITDRRDGGVIRPEFRDPDTFDPYRGQSECAPASSPMAD